MQDVLPRLPEDVLGKHSNQPRAVVGLDVKNAFDSVPHDTVLTKTREVRICARLFNSITAFLQGRTYGVHIGQTTSAIYHNDVGVPQCSVIAQTLLNIALHRHPLKLDAVARLQVRHLC